MGNKVVIAIIPPENLTSKGGLIAPEKSLKYIDPAHAAGRANTNRSIYGTDPDEELDDTRDGYFEWRRNDHRYLYIMGVIIGENTTPKHSGVDFGDVVLFEQPASVDFTAFDRLPSVSACGRTEVYLCDSQTTRWIRVPTNAEVAFCPVNNVVCRVMDYATAAKPLEPK